jgi:hypothetical protein
MPYHFSFSLSLSLSSLCPFSLAHCNRLMFSHLRPIGALGADSSFLSFLVREGRPCYCDAEDIILIWLQQKAMARRRRGVGEAMYHWLQQPPPSTRLLCRTAPRSGGRATGQAGRPGRKGRRVGWRRLRARELCCSVLVAASW